MDGEMGNRIPDLLYAKELSKDKSILYLWRDSMKLTVIPLQCIRGGFSGLGLVEPYLNHIPTERINYIIACV